MITYYEKVRTKLTRQLRLLFNRTVARDFTQQLFTATEMLGYIFTFLVAFITKVLALMFPKIEEVFMLITHQVLMKGHMMKLWVISLVQGWRHSSIGVPLYLLRLSYCPWLFASRRNTPWTDLTGIIRNPFTYRTSFQQSSWLNICFCTAQELLIFCILMYEVAQATVARAEANKDPGGPPPRLYRRISFRIKSTYDSVADMIPDLLPHAREISMATARMIFIEGTLFKLSYIFFDTLQISVQLLTPSSWSWPLFAQSSGSILGNILAKVFIQRYGLGKAFSILFNVWLFSKIWSWLDFDISIALPTILATELRELPGLEGASLPVLFGWHLYKFWSILPHGSVGLLGRWAVVRPALWTLEVIKVPFVVTYDRCSYCVSTIAWLATQLAVALGPSGTVLLVAIILLLSFALFVLIMTDPLQLTMAAYSCSKASRIAAQVTGEREPLKTLHWKAGSSKLIESLPLVDLDQLNRLGMHSADLH